MREEQFREVHYYLIFKSSFTFLVQRTEGNSDQEEGTEKTAGWMMKDTKQVIILPFSVSSGIALITCHKEEKSIGR